MCQPLEFSVVMIKDGRLLLSFTSWLGSCPGRWGEEGMTHLSLQAEMSLSSPSKFPWVCYECPPDCPQARQTWEKLSLSGCRVGSRMSPKGSGDQRWSSEEWLDHKGAVLTDGFNHSKSNGSWKVGPCPQRWVTGRVTRKGISPSLGPPFSVCFLFSMMWAPLFHQTLPPCPSWWKPTDHRWKI